MSYSCKFPVANTSDSWSSEYERTLLSRLWLQRMSLKIHCGSLNFRHYGSFKHRSARFTVRRVRLNNGKILESGCVSACAHSLLLPLQSAKFHCYCVHGLSYQLVGVHGLDDAESIKLLWATMHPISIDEIIEDVDLTLRSFSTRAILLSCSFLPIFWANLWRHAIYFFSLLFNQSNESMKIEYHSTEMMEWKWTVRASEQVIRMDLLSHSTKIAQLGGRHTEQATKSNIFEIQLLQSTWRMGMTISKQGDFSSADISKTGNEISNLY